MGVRIGWWWCVPVAVLVMLVLPPAGCTIKQPPSDTYFERAIAPTLTSGCARSPTGSGCHVADAKGNAFGNLDVSTFAAIDRRRDLLATAYGPYGQPGLLLKVLPPQPLVVRNYDGTSVSVTSDIRHTGGPILDPGASAYVVLRRWIDDGASENNTGIQKTTEVATLPCSPQVPDVQGGPDFSVDPTTADWPDFRDHVDSVLVSRCAAGNCHGNPMNELVLTCGSSPEQVRYNYFAAGEYVGPAPDQSELVRRPLSASAGGSFHEGGVVFTSATDTDLVAIVDWAKAHGPPAAPALGPGFDFFAHRVQPVLVRKGCMQLQCHSSASFHDYRLRGGTAGSFSLSATRRNYQISVGQLALESADPRASRLVRKNLYRPEVSPGGIGIAHRGGPLFEDFAGTSASPALCDAQAYDYDAGDLDQIPAFCVVREWLRRERAGRSLAPLSAVVYVRRPLSAAPDRLQDFDVYRPGADLRMADVTVAAGGAITAANDRSLTAGCGLDTATADIERPSVSWDGKHVAFAARAAADQPLRVYEMNADGSACAPSAAIDATPPTQNGLPVHNFDPVYGPPDAGGNAVIVFASTRGNLDTATTDYSGPQRTPSDPTKPNANLYVYEPDPATPGAMRIRQLTYLLDMERAPSFMQDGRLIFTIEKRLPGFRQMSLRRMNLDGGDYHPLYGQRGSIGFEEVTQVVQLADRNFAAVFADPGIPHRGGALGVFNRTIGVDFRSQNPADYPLDPGLADGSSATTPEAAFFLHSLRMTDASASGRATGATTGFYTSPAPLPDGRILVSFAAAQTAGSFTGDYDVYVADESSGQKTLLLGQPGMADVEAVAVYGRATQAPYRSTPSQPNAYGVDRSVSFADVTLHDVPVISALVMQNTPAGRFIDPDLHYFDVYEELPPPLDVTSFDQGGAFVVTDAHGKLFVRRRLIGRVPVNDDGSAHFVVPGGVPLALRLEDTPSSTARLLPRVLNENFMFTPGEETHEDFPRELFNGFCGQCHGAIDGIPLDVAMRPDVLSAASRTMAKTQSPVDLALPPDQRGPILGP